MSAEEERQARTSSKDKIERLINEAQKIKTEARSPRIQEPERKVAGEEAGRGNEAPTLKKSLKEEILVTLTETSKELSRIIGVLVDETEVPPTEPQTIPRYCCHCGRGLLANALYCDRCGASVRGAC